MTTPRFTLLVPVKDGRGAKTRLGDISDSGRSRLMTAFARDAVAAVLASPLAEVALVGDPSGLAVLATELGVDVVPDEGRGDLNEALRRAAAVVARPGVGVGVMLADLPCLLTADLDIALRYDGRVFVADAAGTGTTLLLAPEGTDLDPRFGSDSAAAHLATGALPVTEPVPTLRLDVDTQDDLDRALLLGVGPQTAAAHALVHTS